MEQLSENWGVNLVTAMKSLVPDNYQNTGANIGTIVNLSPFTISIYDGKILIRSDAHIIYVRGTTGTHSYKVGDKVLVIADNNDMTYFIIDKYTRLGG